MCVWDAGCLALAGRPPSLPSPKKYNQPTIFPSPLSSQAYQCPVYRTEQRGPTYVFTAQLKTKSPPARWVMAGVGLVMDVAS